MLVFWLKVANLVAVAVFNAIQIYEAQLHRPVPTGKVVSLAIGFAVSFGIATYLVVTH